MRTQLMALIRTMGETATEVQRRRQQRLDWRTEEWRERFDSRHWGHITGEMPVVQAE